MLPPTSQRVEQSTAEHINEKIRRQTEQSIAYFAEHPEDIDRRLQELDQEWDTERVLETTASGFSLLGLTFGVIRGRKWYALPLVVNGFLLQHALQGWCPPVEVIRRLGVRTAREIDTERQALKILRGDLQRLTQATEQGRPSPRQVAELVRQ